MSLLLLGLDFHTVAVETREACRWSPERLRTHLEHFSLRPDHAGCSLLRAMAPAAEAAILSTCNRLEFYAVAEAGYPLLRSKFVQLQRQAHVDLTSHLMARRNESVVEHLLQVASSLDLLALGEPYILDQLADALELARECGTAGPILSHLFHQAILTGKRARAKTEIGSRTPCLLNAAVRLLYQRHVASVQQNTLIVGAGKMAQLVVQALQHEEAQPLAFANRTVAHARALASQAPGHTFPWRQMRTALT